MYLLALTIILYFNTFLGILTNFFTFFYYLIYLKNRTIFDIFCISSSLSNLVILLPHFLLMIAFDIQFINIGDTFNKRVGQLVLLGYYTGYYNKLIISLNRFIAIHHPTKYNKIFSKKNTYIALIIFWTLSGLMCIPYSFDEFCYFMLNDKIWTFKQSTFCYDLSYYGDFIFGIISGALTIAIDLLLLWQLLAKQYCSLTRKKTDNYSNPTLRLNLDIFYRTLASNICLIIMLICFYCISHIVKDNVNFVLLTTTIVWISYHMVDGIFVGILNNDVRKKICGIFISKTQQSKFNNLVKSTKIGSRKSGL
uniref:G_PROTEIN_RECEP_F1_2 domain-containing protein n=1 Tax=Strongyloides stercoralis TaxID=6248 RepID=A0A0K0ENS5_STRER